MATIYNSEAYPITDGLQGSDICDDAIRTALRIAADRDESVFLDDDDGLWLVEPDGTVGKVPARQARSMGFESA